MLELDDTSLLLDGLRPPPGFELDVAVGTTFTLDLVTLLAIPVTATVANEADDAADVLETIRRYAEKTILFCQAGAIAIPSSYRPALSLVENSVVEVKKPRGGLFHPKVWIVRFSGRDRHLHRVLVMSRNLTFDRALDVVARFDEGSPDGSQLDTAGVIDLFGALPGVAVRRPTATQQANLDDVLRTLNRAKLAVPEPFVEGSTVAMMPGRRTDLFHGRCDRALAVSPFLSAGSAGRFLESGVWSGIVSRRSALDVSSRGLSKADAVLRVRDAVLTAQQSVDALEDAAGEVQTVPTHSGLHAKVFVQDTGPRATVWLGSANLTDAAPTTNYELMVRLAGPTADVGVRTLLNVDVPRNNLASLVEEHVPVAPDVSEVDDPGDVSELEHLAYDFASTSAVITLTSDGDTFSAELTTSTKAVPDGVTVHAHLLTLPKDRVDVGRGKVVWGDLTRQHITPFVVFTIRRGRVSAPVMVRAELRGDPAGRRAAVIAHAIRTEEDFMRYLAALLGWAPPFGAVDEGSGSWAGGSWGSGSGFGGRLLEDMVTTASRAPDRFGSLEAILAHIESDPELAGLVPEEFRRLWDAVRSRRKVKS